MEYNDEQILSIPTYEAMAKEYASMLKKRGFMLVQVGGEDISLANEVFNLLLKAKSLLFALGGFLNTSKFYSLNERQIKKFAIMFDLNPLSEKTPLPRDKTKCFLAFLSNEFLLIKSLIELAGKSNFEGELNGLTATRLSLLSKLLEI